MLDMGKDLDSPVMVWDLKSTTATNMVSLTGWDQILSTGNVYPTLGTSGTNGFFTFLDDQIRGTVAWSDPSGNYVDKTEFSFASSTPEDQIAGLIGSYDLPNLGRFWFLQSQFELVGYHQTSTGNSPIQMQTLSLQRESSLGSAFSQMLSPVVVGSSAAPLPGVFKDTSLVRGSHVSIAVWDNSSGKVLQPLRYSMEIPQNCLDMSPVQLTADYASFAVPLICEQTTANTVQVQIVQPSAAK